MPPNKYLPTAADVEAAITRTRLTQGLLISEEYAYRHHNRVDYPELMDDLPAHLAIMAGLAERIEAMTDTDRRDRLQGLLLDAALRGEQKISVYL